MIFRYIPESLSPVPVSSPILSIILPAVCQLKVDSFDKLEFGGFAELTIDN